MDEEKHLHVISEAIDACRREVDVEIHEIHRLMKNHYLTEEQAEDIATRAAEKAKTMAKGEIRHEMVADIKIEIADASISVLKNALKMIILFIVGLGFYLGNIKLPWK